MKDTKSLLKTSLVVLLCLITGLFAACGGGSNESGPGNPSLIDAAATFQYNNIAVDLNQDYEPYYTKAGANNAIVFSVDNEQVIIYEFSSKQDSDRYRSSISGTRDTAIGLLLIETDSTAAMEIFQTVVEGNAKKWAIHVSDLEVGEEIKIPRTCEATLRSAVFAPNALNQSLDAPNGNVYLEMEFVITNISSADMNINDLIWARYYFDNFIYQGTTYAFNEQTSSWDQSFIISPSDVCVVKIITIFPENASNDGVSIESEIIISDMYFSHTITNNQIAENPITEEDPITED